VTNAKRSRRLRRLVNWYPPFLGAGIRATRVAEDMSVVDVEMKLRFWNRNYVGTHYGGSLYSMTDPFYMLMLMHRLGPGYVVWDKAATIRFRRPGRGTVRAHFEMRDDKVEEIRARADAGETVEPLFTVDVVDESGTVVAEVEKILHVKKKRATTGD